MSEQRRPSRKTWFLLHALGYSGLALVHLWNGSLRAPTLNPLETVPHTILFHAAPRTLLLQGLVLVYLFALYFHSLTRRDGALSVRDVAILGAIAGVLSWVAFPRNSTDIYSYLGFGRLLALYQMNPYTEGYWEIYDAFSAYPKWEWSMPYGPAVLPVFVVAAFVSRLDIMLGIYFLKLVWLGIHAGTGWLLLKIVRRLDLDPAKSLYVYLLNPLILFELVANGHNDGLMLLFFLLSVELMYRERLRSAFVAAVVAALVKPVGVLLCAAVTVVAIRRGRLGSVAQAGAAAAGMVAALKVALFPTTEALRNLSDARMPANVYSFHSLLLQAGYGEFGQVLTASALTTAYAQPAARVVRVALAGAFALFCLWRLSKIRAAYDVSREMTFMILGLLLGYSASMYPWYVTWLIPFAAMTNELRVRGLVLIYSCSVPILYIPGTLFLSFQGRLFKLLAAHSVVLTYPFLRRRRGRGYGPP